MEAEALRLEAEQKTITHESWLKLEEELRDLHELITTFSITPAVTVKNNFVIFLMQKPEPAILSKPFQVNLSMYLLPKTLGGNCIKINVPNL